MKSSSKVLNAIKDILSPEEYKEFFRLMECYHSDSDNFPSSDFLNDLCEEMNVGFGRKSD